MAGFMECLWEKVVLFTEVAKVRSSFQQKCAVKQGRASVELGVNGLEVLLQEAERISVLKKQRRHVEMGKETGRSWESGKMLSTESQDKSTRRSQCFYVLKKLRDRELMQFFS